MSRRLLILFAATVAMVLTGCADESGSEPSAQSSAESSGAADESGSCDYPEAGAAAKEVDPPPSEPTVSGDVAVTLTTSQGRLAATLDAEQTPCTVGSFVSLAEQGYFDGTRCHRLTTSGIFVLQCGDPTGTGSGGPGYSFADELGGDETYPAGTLAMANAGPNTNGSQFFIVYDNSPLPPSYAVFGKVDADSLAAVRRVAKQGADDSNGPGDGAPRRPVGIESVAVD